MDETTSLNEQAFQLAKLDANATYAPRGVIFGSGFLAGVVITWLPILLFLVIFVWEALFGASVPGASVGKFQSALTNLGQNAGAYASVAWLYSIVLGGLGIMFAYMRALSCMTDWYMRLQLREGEFRLGMHQVIGMIGLPILIGIVLNFVIGDAQVYYILLIPLLLSGLIFNMLFQALQNALLSRMYKLDHVESMVLGLKVFIPRHVGASHAQVAEIKVDAETKTAEVLGAFSSDATRSEVRQIVAHFLRGYNPVHVRHIDEQEAVS